MSMWICTLVHCLQKPKEAVRFLGAEVIGGCNLSKNVCWELNLVPCKNWKD